MVIESDGSYRSRSSNIFSDASFGDEAIATRLMTVRMANIRYLFIMNLIKFDYCTDSIFFCCSDSTLFMSSKNLSMRSNSPSAIARALSLLTSCPLEKT